MPGGIGEDNGGFYLALGDLPVGAEELFFLLGGDEAEAMFLVEADGPDGVAPGSDQGWALDLRLEEGEKAAADALAAVGGADVGVANEGHFVEVLHAHYADDSAVVSFGPEADSGFDLPAQLVARHVGVFPAVGGDDPFVRRSGVVDDGVDFVEVVSWLVQMLIVTTAPIRRRGHERDPEVRTRRNFFGGISWREIQGRELCGRGGRQSLRESTGHPGFFYLSLDGYGTSGLFRCSVVDWQCVMRR